MRSLTLKVKFLLDENVRQELFRFLTDSGLDFKLVPKSSTDKEVASLSKKEKRILVTNDQDFVCYPRRKIFAVILLKLPQNDPELLILSFTRMLERKSAFAGKLIILTPGGKKEYDLGDNLEQNLAEI